MRLYASWCRTEQIHASLLFPPSPIRFSKRVSPDDQPSNALPFPSQGSSLMPLDQEFVELLKSRVHADAATGYMMLRAYGAIVGVVLDPPQSKKENIDRERESALLDLLPTKDLQKPRRKALTRVLQMTGQSIRTKLMHDCCCLTFPSGVVHRWDDWAVTVQGKDVAAFVKMKNPKITFERLQTVMKKGWEEAEKFFYEDVDMETLPDADDDDESNKSADSSSSDSEAGGMSDEEGESPAPVQKHDKRRRINKQQHKMKQDSSKMRKSKKSKRDRR
ncbi:hypothetical protein CEUSTIGMA_g12894.t1 [Chlamydomonas eustigma]|uniref:Uncharacterized protein n=1 Tax=Chlamydomonas eustigma TaxID=1157962 RepID=A0A250XQY8_9CHLO|nr:hypothetical protein CEUSTIGMA_g12894.t1 [Chlamydomonas eustigma]|eukprot:GAX85478.1 hypothetical protein CEUSTIGMA_g12894.t1 [Chlamydomonas eustigma]